MHHTKFAGNSPGPGGCTRGGAAVSTPSYEKFLDMSLPNIPTMKHHLRNKKTALVEVLASLLAIQLVVSRVNTGIREWENLITWIILRLIHSKESRHWRHCSPVSTWTSSMIISRNPDEGHRPRYWLISRPDAQAEEHLSQRQNFGVLQPKIKPAFVPRSEQDCSAAETEGADVTKA